MPLRSEAALASALLGCSLPSSAPSVPVCCGLCQSPLVCASVLWSVPVPSALSPEFQLSREMQSPVFSGKGKCTLQARGQLANMDKSTRPWSLIGLSSQGFF